MCHSQVRPGSSALGPHGGHSQASTTALGLSLWELSWARSICALPKNHTQRSRSWPSVAFAPSFRWCKSTISGVPSAVQLRWTWYTLVGLLLCSSVISEKIRPSGVVLGLQTLSHRGLQHLYMDHGERSTAALDFIKHTRVPFMVLYEFWKNQTQRSCTWVASPWCTPQMRCLWAVWPVSGPWQGQYNCAGLDKTH